MPQLAWAEAEAEAIVAFARTHGRAESDAITGQRATFPRVTAELRAIRQQQSGAWVHIASHGHADPSDPNKCYLLLAGNETLTLAALQRERLLLATRLFDASGCVTGLGDVEYAPDELGSFAADMPQAGSPCAVATLWSVSDRATFLLVLRFMRNALGKQGWSPARAMREAARWLRRATDDELNVLARSGLAGLRSAPTEDERTRDALRGVITPEVESDEPRMSMMEAFPRLAYVGQFFDVFS